MSVANTAPAAQNSGVTATTSNCFLASEQRDITPPRRPSDPQLPWQGHLTACLAIPATKNASTGQNRPLLSKTPHDSIVSDPHPRQPAPAAARGSNPPSVRASA